MKFNYMMLGARMAKTENGFSGKGDWDLYKCFIDSPLGYGEFYLNLNKRTGEGELMPKDPVYGKTLAKAFTSVFN